MMCVSENEYYLSYLIAYSWSTVGQLELGFRVGTVNCIDLDHWGLVAPLVLYIKYIFKKSSLLDCREMWNH